MKLSDLGRLCPGPVQSPSTASVMFVYAGSFVAAPPDVIDHRGFLHAALLCCHNAKGKVARNPPASRPAPNETRGLTRGLPAVRNAAPSPARYSQNNAGSSGAAATLTPDST